MCGASVREIGRQSGGIVCVCFLGSVYIAKAHDCETARGEKVKHIR